jgi:HTH-type transcriptional regulator, sugar sensing transcriptional regulator
MISQKALDALKGIGLNLYERKLYAALIGRGTSTAGELSEMASVPRSRAYDVLESLAEKGFVVIQNAKPLKYVSVPPKEALERCSRKLKDDLSTQLSRIDDFSSSTHLAELETLHEKGVSLVDAADLSGALKGRNAMHQQFETMVKNTEKSLDVITTEQGLNELFHTHAGLLQTAADNGIKIRIAAPLTTKNKEAAGALNDVAEVRHLHDKAPQGRMFLADGKQAVMALTDDKETHQTQDVSFWTSSDHFTQNFAKKTFDMVWTNLK